MKNCLGSNKLERQINRAKKYMNIELVESSNKYLKIKSWAENTFVIVNNTKLVKNGELTVIQPINGNGEVFFKNTWATLRINNYKTNYNTLCVFVENDETKLAKLNELANGCDDLWRLEDFLKNQKVEIERN